MEAHGQYQLLTQLVTEKHLLPWLLPAAWCSRLLTSSREVRRSQNNNAAEALKIGSERIELMKEYGILK